MSIIEHEKDVYENAWALEAYGTYSPGELFLPMFLELTKPESLTYVSLGCPVRKPTVLDAGTGSGKGALALEAANFDVTCCDLTPSGLIPEAEKFTFHEVSLWSDLRAKLGTYDYVYCCDVMEHIPPEFTMLVAQRVIDCCKHGTFFTIALTPDSFGVWVGRQLHQTLRDYQWWREALSELGRVEDARDLQQAGVYYVRPR